MLFIPHFGHSIQVNTYVKQLLVCVHRGYLWLDQPYPITIELIARIIGLPNDNKDPLPYLAKHNTKPIKQKHNLQRAGRGYLLGPIQDQSVHVAAKILSCKIFHKVVPTQCFAEVIEIADLCAWG